MNISIVYWSGTGNTEAMAIAVAAGAEAAGAEVKVLDVSSADESVLTADAILFGCPAMGAEELENSEFLPFFERVEDQLKGKKIGLFGSYGWGGGEWMRLWQERAEADGAVLIADGVICEGALGTEAEAACRELGKIAAL